MKIKVALTAIVISTSISSFAISYIPADLEKFKNTGVCINCDLSEARLYDHDNADLSKSLLVKTSFYGHFYVCDFSSAQLMYADLANIQASGSNFTSANLTGANLKHGNFSSSNFANADLSGANLAGSNLARSNITKEQLSQAVSIDCAILPDGTRSPQKDGTSC